MVSLGKVELKVNDAEVGAPWRLGLGHGNHPVLVIDDFLVQPDQVRAAALAMRYRPPASLYPGVIAPIGGDLGDFADVLRELLGLSFRTSELSTGFSMVTWRHGQLTPGDPDLSFMFGSTEVWERAGFVEMRFNRLVVYDGRLFHSGVVPDLALGDSRDRRWLTLNFFIQSTTAIEPQQRRTA
jgi:hypothetical protein